jgi:RNA polymerase sigma factor (TIGR02999 family)
MEAADDGDTRAADELLPLVYDELRCVANHQMRAENPGQTLTATALVHEAYLRLTRGQPDRPWKGKRHFFNAAALAMRRILVEKARQRRGSPHRAPDANLNEIAAPREDEQLLALDEALGRLARIEPVAAQLVQLRHFAGLTLREAAQTLEIASRSADRLWAYARAWLYDALHESN